MKFSLIFWAVWYAYWIFSARHRVRDTGESKTRREPWQGRAFYLALILAGFSLLFVPRPLFPGDRQWWEAASDRIVIGLAIQAVGVSLALWARATLGKNWSGRITIGGDQVLIVHGPYRIVRHPIYTGGMLAILGTAIVSGWLHSLVGAGLTFVAIGMKIGREEAALREHFGTAYAEYARRVGGLLPGWR